MDAKTIIAARVAKELQDGYVVNLGIGLPTLVPNHLPPDVRITLQSENGFLGLAPLQGEPVPGLVNAGGQPCGMQPGGVFFDSAMSFVLIRGGHVDATVLGALQVDQHGNLANWMVPGKMVPGMGGAMDLVTGARAVYVATTHCDKKGRPKLVKECTLPLTGAKVVSVVVTEFCVVRKVNGKMVLCEISPEITEEELRANTTMDYDISPDLCPMKGIE